MARKLLSDEDRIVLKLARNLRAGYVKDTKGQVEAWTDVPADDKKIWIRTGKRALRILSADKDAS